MNKPIDCLLIGHNEMDFAEYEAGVRKMGTHTGGFRDLDLNFIRYRGRPTTAGEIFNLFSRDRDGNGMEPLTPGETFSGTIAYLGTYLNRRGYSFHYINSFRDNKDELTEKLKSFTYRTIAITTTLYVSVFPITEIVDFINERRRGAKIVLGGPFIYTQYRTQNATYLDYLFNTVIGADYYVINPQGEAALVEILRHLKNGIPLPQIDNVYNKSTAEDQFPDVSRENNILAENMVDWELFSGGVGTYANLRTAVSCPFSCTFCSFPRHAGKYQTAGVEEIEKELISLDKIGTVKSVQFIDDTFNVPVKRFKEILRMMIRNKFGFKWYSHFRCQFADAEMIELMKESGCEGVFLGIESGNDGILKNMNKAVNVEKYLDGIDLLKKNEILSYGSFIIGFPGETGETAGDTLRFIQESGLDFYHAQLWYCEPITPIWNDREKYLLKGNGFEWSHRTMDSRGASDWVDKIFMSVEDPTWIPLNNFEFDAVFRLLHRGLNLHKIKRFIRSFNNGVRDKIKSPHREDAGFNCIEEIRKSLEEEDDKLLADDLSDEDDVDFNF